MNYKFFAVLSIILCWHIVTGTPFPDKQHLPFNFYSVDDGLPQSAITEIYEDSHGFIWIATNEGLARFNGEDFKVYNETTGFPFWLVTGIVEVEPGRLWISTFGNGLWELYHGKARPIHFSKQTDRIRIHHIALTPDSTVLIVTEPGGVYELKNGKVILHIPESDKGISGIAITATKDPFGDIWVGTFKNGVQVFQDKQKVLHLTTSDGLPSNEIRSIFISADHQVWIGTYKGLWVQNKPELYQKFNNRYNNPFIPQIYSPNGKDIWVSLATGEGGVVHFRKGKILEEIRPKRGLGVRYTFINKSRILMLGTYRGLFVFPNQNFTNFGPGSGFLIPYIRAIVRDNQNTLYVATRNDGLYRYHNNAFQRLDYFDPVFKDNSILTMTPIRNQLWIGTNRGLFIVQRNSLIQNKLTDFFRDKTLRRIVPDKDNVIFVLKDTIYTYNLDNSNAQPKNINFNLVNIPISIWGVARDKTGHLCAATNGTGLFQLKDTTWVAIQTRYPIRKIFSIRKAPNGDLYLATSRGVYRWDGNNVYRVLETQYTVWDVLPTQQDVWLLTSKGLQRLKNGFLTIYSRKNGLITTEFNMGAVFADTDSSLWFGGVDGLVRYKKRIDYPNPLPTIYITQISASDSTIYFPSGSFTFPYNRRNLKIQFDWVRLGNPSATSIAYFLEGFDSDTLFAYNGNQVSYTNLPPGEYTFHIFLLNAVNKRLIQHSHFQFKILPPWWLTPWAKLLGVLILIALGYIFVQWRTAFLKKRARRLEETIAKRTREIEQGKKELEKEIEERRKVQASLDKERQLLSITLKSITDGVVTTNLEGEVLLMNTAAEQLMGVSSEEVALKYFSEICLLEKEDTDEPIHFPADIPRYQSEIDSKQYITARLKNCKSNQYNTVAINWAPITDETQNNIGYVWVIRDISTERLLEQEIIKTQKLESIGLLAGGIAHDFNNILTGIIGNAQLAKLKIQMGETDISTYLEGIEKATQNATRLTHQLLTFAKGGEPIKDVISIPEVLQESVEFALTGTNIVSKLQIPDDLWLTRADKGQITQVFNNLVINAVQAMPEGGQLTIICSNIEKSKHFTDYQALHDIYGEHFIKIEFIDTGIGIPQENLSRIFDPYFTTKKSGTGLGLATAYSIIRKHGGKLLVDSEVGKGTRFTIYLPAILENQKNGQNNKPHLFNGKGMKALVMDDDVNILDIVVNFLTLLGFQVETATNGGKAIDMYRTAYLKNNPYDVCILDLTVRGGIGGVDTAREIKKINPNAVIIVASGYSTDSALANYQEFGFSGRITKPFSLESFNAILNQIFSNKKVT